VPAVNILLVEDDPSMGMLISQILGAAGYQVAWAKDGMQAMQMAKQSRPALIISDFMFPAGGGATFFQRLRMSAQTTLIPIVILSSAARELIAATVAPDVNAYYMPKPYNKAELLTLIAGLSAGAADSAFLLHQGSAASPAARAPAPAPAPKAARGCVIVIAGNAEERVLIRLPLEKKGFRVVEAGDGAAALSTLGLTGGALSADTTRPNLIVLDAELDLGTGHLLNARLALEPSTHSVPVLVVTGGKEMRAAFSDAANVAAYLNKPLDPERLLRHVEELIPVRI
jgi:DNA-binding response OmpR family regulator